MIDTQKFHIKGEFPTITAQQKGSRVVKVKGKLTVMHYTKPEVKKAAEKFCRQLLPFKPKDMITGPCRVQITWVFPWRKSEKKSIIKKYQMIPKTTKPDVGNMTKLFLDCMTKVGYFTDDAIVFNEDNWKFWGDDELVGIHVKITTGPMLGAVEKKV